MSKLKSYLSRHLRGDVVDDQSVLNDFATDSSIFYVKPRAIVYPENVTDVRKLMKFSWQLAERGKHMPVTVRGKGSDMGGGAVGEGLMVSMPAAMTQLLDMDRESVTVEPGMLFGDLQRTLQSHGRALPFYPASADYSTIGGAVANNASGEKTLKYGATADYVKELEVVLANGDVIRTQPLSKKELNKKKGQTDFEGDIYRAIDGLLQDNTNIIQESRRNISKNTAGYALGDVWRPDGTFDLSRLIVGSQGTLGVVTEVTLYTEDYNPDTHLLVVDFDDIEKAARAAEALQRVKPSSMEMVDRQLLHFVQQARPGVLESMGMEAAPRMLFLVEFDEDKTSSRKRKSKKARKLLRELASQVRSITDPEEQEGWRKVRRNVAAMMWTGRHGHGNALPLIEDSIVPLSQMSDYLGNVYALLERYECYASVWGHVGNGNFHVQPVYDLSNATDRQTIFQLMNDFYQLVLHHGGSTSGEHNDGRLRAPYLRQMYGEEMYQLLRQVKEIFDPYHILNPGVKMDVDQNSLRKQLRSEYTIDHLHDYLSRAHH